MSGPIVRSGASPAFSKNWESIFGKKSSSGGAGGKKSAKSAKAKPAKSAKAPKKAAKKK